MSAPWWLMHIDRTPGTCGGRPRIKGTRIDVIHVQNARKMGMSLDEIQACWPFLSMEQIRAALAHPNPEHRAIRVGRQEPKVLRNKNR